MTNSTHSDSFLDNVLQNNLFLRDLKAREHTAVQHIVDGPCPGTYKYKLATKRQDMLDQFNLRYLSYKEQGYLNPDHPLPDELEYDCHDLNAALFIVRNSQTKQLHGSGRLVIDVSGKLPIDEYYSLDQYRQSIGYGQPSGQQAGQQAVRIAEFSRLISRPIGQRAMNRKLVKFILEFAVQAGITHLVGFGRCDIKHYYERWGFKDIEQGVTIDLRTTACQLTPPMQFYPHAMRTDEILWKNIDV